jgi:hypothetical protein
MMNLTINRDDYATYESFMIELKKALRYKGNLLAKQAVNSLDTSNMYKTLLPDYLYYRLFEEMSDPVNPPVSTYIINVEQIGGKGSYFIKYGKYRKNTNLVEFRVYPPAGMYVVSVTYNTSRLTGKANNVYFFTMPEEDVLIQITYSLTMPETSIVYWGISTIETISNINTYNILHVQPDQDFSIQFDNLGNPGYIWFATELPVTLQSAEAFKGSKFLITGSFNEQTQSELENYTLYVHKWPTEIDKINFYYG